MRRRRFLSAAAAGALGAAAGSTRRSAARAGDGGDSNDDGRGESLVQYVKRTAGRFDQKHFNRWLGAANAFKEGDASIGVAADSERQRAFARRLLERTTLAEIDGHPPWNDQVTRLIDASLDRAAAAETAEWTLGRLKQFVLTQPPDALQALRRGWSSHVIGCLVKIMSDDELIAAGARIFNPLPQTKIGAEGYLGARIQPNSPTDHVDDIRWQVFNGWAYGVGDVLLGANPVSSEPESVRAVEQTLQDVLRTFALEDTLPHCVLSHIDVQAEVESRWPGSTALWFQSIAGVDSANATFDVSVESLRRHARSRRGRYGLYFETGQGADLTNGHAHGFDMVLHESRKYGLARALSQDVAAACGRAPWVHLNDVAGFIGPEVFRSRQQLVRCCLEDIVMGKLHGLCLGLDVCSTLHMDISLDDLDWCLDQVLPAHPAYLMALPTKIDPMLGYLTTGFQDHVRLREKFQRSVNPPMLRFFQQLKVLDDRGRPGPRFGKPAEVYVAYCRRRGDGRSDQTLRREADQQMAAVRERGVFLASGHGAGPGDLAPSLAADIRRIYEDAKESIWAQWTPESIAQIPDRLEIRTTSKDREDYILHPTSGERLDAESRRRLEQLRDRQAGRYNVQLVLSDGLNALSMTAPQQLAPFLELVREGLAREGFVVAPQPIVVHSGRVRAGYRIGETLFGGLPGARAVIHVIGERPGTGHRTFSAYITAPAGEVWKTAGQVDHNLTKVVSGIAVTAQRPAAAAAAVIRLLNTL